MANITTNTLPAHSGSFFKAVGKYLKAYAVHRKAQAEYRHLMRLSNHDLRDMGVTRDDVREQLMRRVSWPGAL